MFFSYSIKPTTTTTSIALSKFFTGTVSVVLLKLTSSIDDVVWLSAFLTPSIPRSRKITFVTIYIAICQLQTFLAFLISAFGQETIKYIAGQGSGQGQEQGSEPASVDRILTLVAGGALLIYTILLAIEYYREHYCTSHDQNDTNEPYNLEFRNTSTTKDQPLNESVEGTGTPTGDQQVIRDATNNEDDEEEQRKESKDVQEKDISQNSNTNMNTNMDIIKPLETEAPLSSPTQGGDHDESGVDATTSSTDSSSSSSQDDKTERSFAIIAFLGSLDDLVLFSPMLTGKAFGIEELVIGSLMGTVVILALCFFINKCQRVAEGLERIPLVGIVGIFCTILLMKGIFFME